MENYILDINKTLSAPLARVWEAWTTPEDLANWMSPGPNTTIINKMEFKEGGEFSFIIMGMTFTGFFKAIIPKTELSFTWNMPMYEHETLITVKLKEDGNQTEMHFRHEGFKDEQMRDMQKNGWGSGIENLVRHLS